MSTKKTTTSYEEDDEDTRCGLGPCRGSLLQRCANKKSYLITYSFLGLLQGMFFSYSIATLTTVEKQFQFKSQTTGILLSGNECSQILLSLLLTYFGGQGHRPRLAAIGVICSGISSLLVVMPHFIYGKANPIVTNASAITDVCPAMASDGVCPDFSEPIGPMVFIFMSQFISGIGTTLFSTLGITYLDDNVRQKSTPMLIGIMFTLRMIGPTLGYALGAIFMRMHVNITETTTLKPTDPSWIGAWWLGFLVIGVAQLSTSWLLALYPRYLPGTKTSKRKAAAKQRTWKEFPKALKRLLTNRIVVINNLNGIFYVFALGGYITFVPKFIETQYQQSASNSALVNGGIGILFMCAGSLLAGFLISRFRPRAWVLVTFDVFTGVLFCGSLIAFAYLQCNPKPIVGIGEGINTLSQLSAPCNVDCSCQPNLFKPVCSKDGTVNFFSGCFAGCQARNGTGRKMTYSECSCIESNPDSLGPHDWVSLVENPGEATSGYCPSDCSSIFWVYVFGMAIIKFLSSMGRISSIIISFRCVDPDDKSFSIGLSTLLISLFAFIPGPIVYGAIIDKACILWKTECGRQGNCWLYDPTKMRQYLHFTTAVFVALGILTDLFKCRYVRGLELYGDNEEQDKTAEQTDVQHEDQAMIPEKR